MLVDEPIKALAKAVAVTQKQAAADSATSQALTQELARVQMATQPMQKLGTTLPLGGDKTSTRPRGAPSS